MSSDISLTAAQRLALIDLSSNASLSSRTQRRLSSGKKINSVVDDSVNYFKAKQLEDRAKDFSNLKNDIGQAVTHLQVTLEAVSSIETILNQIKGIVEASRSQTTAERTLASKSVKELGKQFTQLVKDASYGGSNLIGNTAQGRIVQFGTRAESKLELPGLDLINGADANSRVFSNAVFDNATEAFSLSVLSGGTFAGLSDVGANNSNIAIITSAVSQLNAGVKRLRGHAQSLGANVAILQARESFTDKYVSLNTTGSEKYTLANLNAEGANLVALQTRQQLGIQSLSVAGQQQRAILTLLQ